MRRSFVFAAFFLLVPAAWASWASSPDGCGSLLADDSAGGVPTLRELRMTPRVQAKGSWRVATVSPEVSIADPRTNAERIGASVRKAVAGGANLVALPELAVSGYTANELLHTSTVRDESRRAILAVLDATKDSDAVVVVGAPYEAPNGRMYNVGFVIQRGKILGAVPKSYMPTYKEFYDERFLQSGREAKVSVSDPLLGDFPLSTDLLFDFGGVTLAVEVCEDGWAPFPPVRRSVAAGAMVVVNLSASTDAIGKPEFRRDMVADLSAHHDVVYVYAAAGTGESTQDVVFRPHSMVARAGRLVAENTQFSIAETSTVVDVDFDGLGAGRLAIDDFFQRIVGQPVPRRASVGGDVRDLLRDAPVAVTPVPAAGPSVAGADWRRHGYARLSLQRSVGAVDAEAEVRVLDRKGKTSGAELTAAGLGKGILVVRDDAGIRVYAPGVWLVSPSSPSATVPEQLPQYQAGALRFAVLEEKDEQRDFPASTWQALAGATTVVVFVDRLDARTKRYYEQQSARLNAAFLVVARAGVGEGATALAIENGSVVWAEGAGSASLAFDVDLDKLRHERVQNRTFGVSPGANANVALVQADSVGPLTTLARRYGKAPFVPRESSELDRRSEAIITQQAWGLYRRLLAARTTKVSLGVSGGSDSTLALLVYLKTCEIAGWDPAEHIVALSMPGFGTSERTRAQAKGLGAAAGIEVVEKDIRPAALQVLRDQNHPLWQKIAGLPYRGPGGWVRRLGDFSGRPLPPEVYYRHIAAYPELQDVGFENAQARERTLLLMQHGFVLGTGDMSELALGWATYNADHMAMYNPNSSVPKTLVKHLIRWYANHSASPALKKVLLAILDTPVSPELKSPRADGTIAQVTEESVGPYILNDFFLFHYVRNGYSARKIYDLACREFAEGTPGVDAFPPDVVKKWLKLFFERFFAQQYKRTVIPPGPKIGSVSLSSRGDWRMADEASVRSELEGIESW